MRIQFAAPDPAVEHDGNVVYGDLVSDDSDEPEHFLTLQRVILNDTQGIRLEYNDENNDPYDCIANCQLSRRYLQIDLSRPLGALTDITGFDIALSLDDERKHAEFAATLTIIFQGTTLLQIN